MNPLWLFLIVPVSVATGFIFAGILLGSKQYDARMTARNAFQYGHELGLKGLDFILAMRKFNERFKDL